MRIEHLFFLSSPCVLLHKKSVVFFYLLLTAFFVSNLPTLFYSFSIFIPGFQKQKSVPGD